MTEPLIRIGLYDSVYIVPPVTNFSVGTHTFRLHAAGNSLLSTVYVRNATGTVQVKYYDYGAGDDDGIDLNSRIELASHPVLSANSTDRRVITKIHNHPRLEIIVTGGSAEVAILGSIVADFPLSGNLLDGQTANLGADGGLPIAVYDETLNKFFLLRGNNGVIPFDPFGYATGKVFTGSASLSVSVTPTILISQIVPIGKKWRLNYAEIICRGYGRWYLTVNGSNKAAGSTGADNNGNSRAEINNGLEASAGQTVEIAFTYSHGPASMPVDAFLGIQEI